MSLFAGTPRLIRLALRRDRIKLPVWIVAVFCFLAVTLPALAETYPTQAERLAYVSSIASGAIGKLFAGNIDNASFGAIVTAETLIYTAIIIAFLNVLLVVRHTRQNEELGSAELINSARVGRFASLTAAMIVALGANSIIALGLAGILLTSDEIPVEGAWLYGVGMGLCGMTFAAIAAIMAQFSEAARGATSFAAIAIGGAFILRGIGDVFSMTVDGKTWPLWTSWISPLGLLQLSRPLTLQEWWPLLILAAMTIIAIGLSYALLTRRDVGLGIFPARKGPSRASLSLKHPMGLAVRMQRGVFTGWIITLIIMAVIVGGMSNQLLYLIEESDVMQVYIASMGGGDGIIELFMSAMLAMLALMAVAYVVQALQRLRSEESSGRLESLLSTALGRTRWVMSHVIVTMIGATVILIGCGITLAISAGIANEYQLKDWQLWEYVVGAISYLPSLLVFAGLTVVTFGWLPRMTILVSWLAFTLVVLIGQLGALLKFPEWLMNISPFSHLASVPSETMEPVPLIVLSSIAVVLLALGLVGFRRRSTMAG